ncbi:MAG: hypothetical protein R3D69_07035 [Xanthobacteraceae bacterium]
MPSQHLSVLISTKLDPHVDAISRRPEGSLGVPCFRLNTDHFHEEYRIAMTDEPTGTSSDRRQMGSLLPVSAWVTLGLDAQA